MAQSMNPEGESGFTAIDSTIMQMLDPEISHKEKSVYGIQLLCQIAASYEILEISESSKERLSDYSKRNSMIGMAEPIDSPDLLGIVTAQILGFDPFIQEALESNQIRTDISDLSELIYEITRLGNTERPDLSRRTILLQEYYRTSANVVDYIESGLSSNLRSSQVDLLKPLKTRLESQIGHIWNYTADMDIPIPIEAIPVNPGLYYSRVPNLVIESPFALTIAQPTDRPFSFVEDFAVSSRIRENLVLLSRGEPNLRLQSVIEFLKITIDIVRITPEITVFEYNSFLQDFIKRYSTKLSDESPEKIYLDSISLKPESFFGESIQSHMLVFHMINLLNKLFESHHDLNRFAVRYRTITGITVIDRLLLHYFRNQHHAYNKFADLLLEEV